MTDPEDMDSKTYYEWSQDELEAKDETINHQGDIIGELDEEIKSLKQQIDFLEHTNKLPSLSDLERKLLEDSRKHINTLTFQLKIAIISLTQISKQPDTTNTLNVNQDIAKLTLGVLEEDDDSDS